MQMTPTSIFGLALFAYALTCVPDKYRPAWTHRLGSWQTLIGLVAVIAAILIVMNPEFYALGILGDSAFFDLLVLAISIQLQVLLSRIGVHIVAVLAKTIRFINLRIHVNYMVMVLAVDGIVSMIQKVLHRISS